MKKVVILGANSFQNPLIQKAKSLGYETHVFAWADNAVGEKTADYFYPISITEKDKILEKCREIKPVAITSIASDLASISVNYIANGLGLPCNDPSISSKCTNKFEMRKAFAKAGIPVPNFQEITYGKKIDLNNFTFPLIVKPTDRSGSRGIFLCKNEDELYTAIKNSTEFSFEGKAIVEEFINGEEYSCECISQNGKHYFLAITKKFTTGAPNFIETGHLEPADFSDDMREKIKNTIFKALDALEIKNSASHSEFRVDSAGNIGIIEIGARMGGDCIGSNLVQISTGYDFLKMTLDVALGEPIKLERTSQPKIAIVKFIFTKSDIEKMEIIEKHFPDLLFFKSDIDNSEHPIIDSSSRLGYFILACNTYDDVNNINLKLKENHLDSIL